jgi:hypothetical protein
MSFENINMDEQMTKENLIHNCVQELLKSAKEIDPTISKDLHEIVNSVGGKFEGFENRFKKEESLIQKLQDRVRPKHGATFIEALDSEMELLRSRKKTTCRFLVNINRLGISKN